MTKLHPTGTASNGTGTSPANGDEPTRASTPRRPAPPARPESPERPGRATALPPDERRATIIDAALPLLREHGRAVTTRQIADAAAIAEGTIFRVFASKDELIEAAVDRALDVDDTVQAIAALDPGASLERSIVRCAEILRDRMVSVIDLMMALHRPEADSDEHADRDPASKRHPRHRRRRDPNDPQHRAVLEAIAARLAPHAHRLSYSPERSAQLLRLMTFAGTHRMVAPGDQLAPAEITDVLLHGILNDPMRPPVAKSPKTQPPKTQSSEPDPPETLSTGAQPTGAQPTGSQSPATGAAPGTPSYRPAHD